MAVKWHSSDGNVSEGAQLLQAFQAMRTEVSAEIQQVKSEVSTVVEKALKPLDERLQSCEKLMTSFESRLSALENSRPVGMVEEEAAGTAQKRARSAPTKGKEGAVAVLCGFPKLCRKKEIENLCPRAIQRHPGMEAL